MVILKMVIGVVLKYVLEMLTDYINYKRKEKRDKKKAKEEWSGIKKEKDPVIRAKLKRNYFNS